MCRARPILLIAACVILFDAFVAFSQNAERQAQVSERRAAQVAVFRDRFEKAARLSARERLKVAADMSADLRKHAEKASAERLDRADIAASPRIAVFPKQSHLIQFVANRPWCRDYWKGRDLAIELLHATREFVWPTKAEQEELRKLTRDKEPDVQALAVEALATLHDPDDLTFIEQHLDGGTQVVPLLLPSARHLRSALVLRGDLAPMPDPEDPIVLRQSWHSSQLKGYAERALKLMTGYDLDSKSYWQWRSRDGRGRESLWYWQQRFQRELDSIDLAVFQRPPDEPFEGWWAKGEEAKSRRRDVLQKELAAMPPEVEAKVRLLAKHRNAGGADMTEEDQRFFDGPMKLRLQPDRLLGLIDRQQLWHDVEWGYREEHEEFQGPYYNRMVQRIALSAETFFEPSHVPRLKALFAKHRRNLWWSGQTAFIRGIARLLPPAPRGRLDDAKTREGWLRQAVRNEKDVFVRGYTARELVRVGLPDNWPFLKSMFFTEEKENAIPNLRASIITELGETPFTDAKLNALVDLVEDRRFGTLLTQKKQVNGYRRRMVSSLKAQYQSRMALADEKPPPEALDALLESLRKFATPRR